MITRSQKIRLGIFVSVGIFALLILIATIIAPKILKHRDIYYIGYRDVSVTGLQDGSSVKYHGITVGYVKHIFIDPKDIQRVIVEISLEPETPIKEDTYGELAFLGITGLKVVELQGGSNEALALKSGSYIKPGRSITDAITGKAEVIAEKAELILNNIAAMTTSENRQKMLDFVETTSKTVDELYDLLHKNNKALTATISNSEAISVELNKLAITSNNTMTKVDQLIQSDSLQQVIGNLQAITKSIRQADFIQLVEDYSSAINHIHLVLNKINATLVTSQSDLVYTINSMKETADYLNQFSRSISEDPSVLIRGTRPENAPDAKLEK
jgi:phospholipid/cholesterol/gamma-HCH transport system substrate-binding protein